jgi:hypothetical protein
MNMSVIRFSLTVALVCAAVVFTLTACSQGGSDSLAGPDVASVDSEVSSATVTAEAPDAPEATASGSRLEARLNPVIGGVDASGQARLDAAAGTANDRFTSEIEIARIDLGALDVTPGNGFNDEVVRLTVQRGGTQIFSGRLQFSENRPRDITFENDIRGPGAPELQRGDVARVTVNGHSTLRGTFQ